MRSTPTAQGFSPAPGLLAACAALLAALLYARTAGFGFIFLDDTLYITENPHVLAGLTLDSLRWALSFNDANYWHPVTWLSLLLDSTLYGDWAGGFHLTNVIFHCANASLLYFLVLRWFGLARPQGADPAGAKWAAFGVALAFALHPAHVESVAWVTERKDVLLLFFGLLSLRSYTVYAQRRAAGEKASLLPALGWFVPSLLSKPMLVTMPALLLLLDFWPLGRLRADGGNSHRTPLGALLMEKLLFLVPALAMGVIAIVTHPQAYGAEELTLGLRLGNGVASYLDYLRLLFWPEGLALVYPYPASVPALKLAGALLLLAGATAAALWQLKRRPHLAVCWFWFVGTLAPILIPPKVGLHVAYADRWLYLPAIGISLGLALLAWEGLSRLSDGRLRQRAAAGLLAALVLGLGALSHRQLDWWRDGMTVYERVLAVTDENYFVMNNYGVQKMRAGDFQAAEKWMRKSLAIQPGYDKALGNLGILYANTERYAQALPFLAAALAKDASEPCELAEDHYVTGLCLARLGRYDEAEPHYRAALKIMPQYAQAYNDLGNIASLRGRPDQAEELYAKALEINPTYAVARENLARARAQRATAATSPAQNP
ncbi:MAG: tetratricopeptide repeat protein [Desulfovibrio sp.]|jgi:tetratricopeptide (TPR) repeat protein|nr:tetratricopeptide repeat protein [Desulfovibrio sp.]